MSIRGGRWAIVWGILAVTAAQAAEPWMAKVEEVLKTPGFQSGHWGLLVVDAASGKTVYEHNADELFCPASVTKLFSTATALADLGADYRFQTPVVRRGQVDQNGTLRGDLILVAQGDLSLGGRTGPDGTLLFEDNDHTYANGNADAKLVAADPLAGLDHLAREVAGAGIAAILGDVLVDDRLFEPASSTGSGPARLTPILINDNVIDVVVTPSAQPDEPARVKMVPATSFVTMDAQVETVAEGPRARIEIGAEGPRRFSVRGRIPVGHKPLVRIYEVEEPASFARALFIESLRKRGVRVVASPLGTNAVGALPPPEEVKRLPKVAEYISPPLREYIRVTLKVSHNLHASTLPLLVAVHHGETTLDAGLKREGEFLKGLGLDMKAISFGGGAGGSRADLVTPRATVALLRAMARRSDFATFEAALPVLGRDGTLAKAVDADSPARGHARAKTGTYWVDNGLNGQGVLTSKALAGYLETAAGRTLVFAFFLNNVPIHTDAGAADATTTAGKLLGKLCEIFYTCDAPKPSAPKGGAGPEG
jgi:D-alanyl-D-alanine carboxypeptidase/D-alanyl-D-alanine-endopeptidase (penicillin-binding protein 4)